VTSTKRSKGVIVAIDGPAGAGKSTVSREVARRLGYVYLDTGAMYRVVGWLARERGVDPDDGPALATLAGGVRIGFAPQADGSQRVTADGRDVTKAIREEDIGQWASKVSARPEVREKLLALQRAIGRDGGVVVEGRDIGTVVFPDAEAKFFLEAAPEARAERRWKELRAKGGAAELDEIVGEMRARDARDSSRSHAPLRQAPDAERIDSTALPVEKVIDLILARVRGKAIGS
jgi:CMP/dCMP kinase